MPDHPLPVSALADRQLALLSGDFATRIHVDAHLAAHGVRPRIAVEANSVQALTELVQRTALATVLPDAVTDDHPRLARVGLTPPLPPRTASLLRRDGGYLSAAARAFTTLAADVAAARGYAPPATGLRPGAT